MGKYRKYKLSWQPSISEHVAGYRLYWSKKDAISYDSNFIDLGDVCEVVLPDIFKYPPPHAVSLRLGISAVDMEGNESNIVLLSENYQATAPVVPSGLSIETLDDYTVLEDKDEDSKNSEDDQLEVLAGMSKRLKSTYQPETKEKDEYQEEV